ncbi:polyketide synthase [Sorangium sp. So ce1014]|uniref:polyketide synthase n=1 Tax=Sorangium sp. So ce1014 TaxID=3133326 RepID=UPI003F629958
MPDLHHGKQALTAIDNRSRDNPHILSPTSGAAMASTEWGRRAQANRGDEVILRLIDGASAWVEIDDPAHDNALSEGLVLALLARFQEIAGRPEIKVVVLTGRDDVFLKGSTEAGLLDAADGGTRSPDLSFLCGGLLRCEVPVIAAMQGQAEGAGLCFGLYADVVVLAEEGIYSANFIDYGLTPGLGATFILREQLGGPLATEMMYLGRSYTGRELRDRGVSLAVRPMAEVRAEALAIARRLAEKPREALVVLKRELAGRKLAALPRVVDAENEMRRRVLASPEARDQIRSRLEKAGLRRGAPAASAGPPPVRAARELIPPASTPAAAEVDAPTPIARQPVRLRPKETALQPLASAPIAPQRVSLPPKHRAAQAASADQGSPAIDVRSRGAVRS